jgi:hypothetical protein
MRDHIDREADPVDDHEPGEVPVEQELHASRDVAHCRELVEGLAEEPRRRPVEQRLPEVRAAGRIELPDAVGDLEVADERGPRLVARCQRVEEGVEVGDVNVWPVAAATVFVAAGDEPKGSLVPVPVVNLVASRSSFDSASSRPISTWRPPQSMPTSMENGMNAWAFSVEIVGWARVGLLSVVSVASAA